MSGHSENNSLNQERSLYPQLEDYSVNQENSPKKENLSTTAQSDKKHFNLACTYQKEGSYELALHYYELCAESSSETIRNNANFRLGEYYSGAWNSQEKTNFGYAIARYSKIEAPKITKEMDLSKLSRQIYQYILATVKKAKLYAKGDSTLRANPLFEYIEYIRALMCFASFASLAEKYYQFEVDRYNTVMEHTMMKPFINLFQEYLDMDIHKTIKDKEPNERIWEKDFLPLSQKKLIMAILSKVKDGGFIYALLCIIYKQEIIHENHYLFQLDHLRQRDDLVLEPSLYNNIVLQFIKIYISRADKCKEKKSKQGEKAWLEEVLEVVDYMLPDPSPEQQQANGFKEIEELVSNIKSRLHIPPFISYSTYEKGFGRLAAIISYPFYAFIKFCKSIIRPSKETKKGQINYNTTSEKSTYHKLYPDLNDQNVSIEKVNGLEKDKTTGNTMSDNDINNNLSGLWANGKQNVENAKLPPSYSLKI